MSHYRPATAAAAVLLAVLMSACGSTVQTPGSAGPFSTQGGSASGAASELGAAAEMGAPAGPLNAPEDASVVSGSDPGTAGSTSGSDGGQNVSGPSSAETTTSAGRGQPKAAPGVAASTVTVGFQYLDESKGSGIAGTTSQDSGDARAQAEATVKWINAHGGIGGRKMALAVHAVDYAQLNSGQFASEIQKNCTAWTEDKRVLIATLRFNHPNLITCLGKKGTSTVGGTAVIPEKTFKAAPYYTLWHSTYDRGIVASARAFRADGFVDAKARVGVLYQEDSLVDGTKDALVQELKRLSIPYTEYGVTASTPADGASGASQAVLRFKSDGVTHVMFVVYGGGGAYLFMNAAEGQSYRPKYALNSGDNADFLRNNAPAAQLANARIFGWLPGEAASEQSAVARGWNSNGKLCFRLLRDAGVEMSTPWMAIQAITVCDQLLSVQAILANSPELTQAGIARGAARLGTGYQSARAFSTTMGPERPAGATATRYLAYDRDCTCWLAAGRGPDL